MAVPGEQHRDLDANGEGLCSVPMWRNGFPDGFCEKTAYGAPIPGRYDGYVPGLACPLHGGPDQPLHRSGNQEKEG